MFSFTRLQPLHPENRDLEGPKVQALAQEVCQSLLSFPPDFTLLVDVGWDPALSMDLSHLITAASTIDAILLTHATISHLGAYAYLCKMSSTFAAIPVYSTLPVINMGRMITLDAYRSKGLLGPFIDEKVTLEDVELAFDKITPLKYLQTMSLEPGSGNKNNNQSSLEDSEDTKSSKSHKSSLATSAAAAAAAHFNLAGSIQVTPYNAGHTLGGTIWKIVKDQEAILYAVDWNHSRDSHLNGAFLQQDDTLIEALSKPSLMVCGTKISQLSSTQRKRKESLFRNIHDTIEMGGTVLIPTSTGSRVLELAHILDSHWEEKKISAPLIYFSHVGARTLSYASSMLEWMSSNIISEWQVQNNSPFDVKHLRVMSSVEELLKMDGPKVILAAGEAMEVGLSRRLFSHICSRDNSMVILTERTGPETLSGQLFDIWMKNKQESNDPESSSKYLPAHVTTQIKLDYEKEEPLAGEELIDYLENVREKKQKLELQSAIELRNKNILEQEDNELSDDDDNDDEDEMVMSGQMDIGIFLYGKDVYDYDVRTMPKGKPKMFPFAVKRRRVDDYGEVLKSDQFSKHKEKEEAEKNALLTAGTVIKTDPNSGSGNDNTNNQSGTSGSGSTGGPNSGSILDGTQIYNNETSKLDSFSSMATPQKLVPTYENLKMLCYVDFIDFDGIADIRSLRMILQLVEPRQVIFLPSCLDIRTSSSDGGETSTTLVSSGPSTEPTNVDEIVSEFEQGEDLNLDLVAKASANEAVIIQIGSNSYSLIISPELEKQLKWQKIVGDYSVAHVTGRLDVSTIPDSQSSKNDEENETKDIEMKDTTTTISEDTKNVDKKSDGDEDVKMEGSSDDTNDSMKEETKELSLIASENGITSTTTQVIRAPRTVAKLVPLQTAADFSAAPRFSPSLVGDIRLAELKRLLISKGHKAEFKAEGILVCDDKVAIRKLSQGNIVIEGGTGSEFYRVKGVVRSLLAFV